jgi:maltose alpha-D-glucosyltransferase / alpha-amylase
MATITWARSSSCRDDVAIIDFEGEPTRPLPERTARTSPLRDVAGMLRSFDYALWTTVFHRIALGGDPEATLAAVEDWRGDTHRAPSSAPTARQCEGSTLGGRGHAFAERQLLDLFLIQKVAYEIGYELAMRPDWVRIPLEGLRDLLGPDTEGAP